MKRNDGSFGKQATVSIDFRPTDMNTIHPSISGTTLP